MILIYSQMCTHANNIFFNCEKSAYDLTRKKITPKFRRKSNPPPSIRWRGGYITFFGAALPIYAAKSVIVFLLDGFHVATKPKEVYYEPVR